MSKETTPKKQKKNKNPYLMYSLFCFIQGLLGILPIMIYIICKWDKFFGNKTTCVSNVFGLLIAVVFLVLIFTKQTKILKGLGGFVIFAIIVTLMRSVIEDLYMISWLAVLGMVLSKIISVFTLKWKSIINNKPTNDTMRETTQQIVQALNGRG